MKINKIKEAIVFFYKLNYSTTIKNIIYVFSGDFLSKIFLAATIFIIIRNLNVPEFAEYTIFSSIFSLIPGLIGNGINTSLIRFSANYVAEKQEKPFFIYIMSFITQFIVYIFFLIVMLIFWKNINQLLFGKTEFKEAYVYGVIGGSGLLITNAARGIYLSEENYKIYVKTLWLKYLAFLVTIYIIFAIKLLTFMNVVIVQISIEMLTGSLLILHIFKNINIKDIIYKYKEIKIYIKEFIIDSGWLTAYILAMTVLGGYIGIFMLIHFSTKTELANYGVAFKYYSVSLLVLGSINSVLLPKFSKIAFNALNSQKFIFKWLKTTWWIIIPTIIFILYGKPLYVFISGEQYEKSFYMFSVLSIGICLSLMLSPLVNILISKKDFKFLFLLSIAALLINLIGNYFFVKKFGGLGAAIVVLLTQNFFIQTCIFIKIIRRSILHPLSRHFFSFLICKF